MYGSYGSGSGTLVHLHHSYKKKRHNKEVTKQWKSRFFLLFLLDDGRIRFRTCDLRMQIREAQKHTDPTDPDADPDPQHWFARMKFLFL